MQQKSLFLKYILSFFPILKTLIEKINGKRKNEMTYLHKDTSILRRVILPTTNGKPTQLIPLT